MKISGIAPSRVVTSDAEIFPREPAKNWRNESAASGDGQAYSIGVGSMDQTKRRWPVDFDEAARLLKTWWFTNWDHAKPGQAKIAWDAVRAVVEPRADDGLAGLRAYSDAIDKAAIEAMASEEYWRLAPGDWTREGWRAHVMGWPIVTTVDEVQ